MQKTEPVGANLPLKQTSQEAAPPKSTADCPALHSLQLSLAALAYFPPVHAMHAAAPGGDIFPAPQGSQ